MTLVTDLMLNAAGGIKIIVVNLCVRNQNSLIDQVRMHVYTGFSYVSE